MLLNWGLQKADELDVEIFLDSTPWAVPFYTKSGFVRIDDVSLNMHVENPSEEWKEWEKKILPYGWYVNCFCFLFMRFWKQYLTLTVILIGRICGGQLAERISREGNIHGRSNSYRLKLF